MPRLKLHRSRNPELEADDILISTALPMSLKVHQFTLIIKRSGGYEFVDQITGSDSSQHIARTANESQLATIENQLENLRSALDWIAKIQLDDFDPELHESNDRRIIRFWSGNGPVGCTKLNPDFYDSIHVEPESVKTFERDFDKLWMELIALAHDASIELGPDNSFPLQTIQKPIPNELRDIKRLNRSRIGGGYKNG